MRLISTLLAGAAIVVGSACSGEEISERDKFLSEYKEVKAEVLSTNGGGHPALWKMNDDDTTIYLFGTVHLLPTDLDWQNDVITQAFNASQKVFFEMDLESMESIMSVQKLVRERGYLAEGENLYEKMDPEDAKNVKIALEGIGFKPDALNNLQPWNASMNLMQYYMMEEGMNPMAGVEMVLTEQAKDNGMSFGYLETGLDQMNAISGGTFEEQLDAFVDGMEYLDMVPEVLDLMLDEWADGDVKGIGLLAATPDTLGESQGSYERMLVIRNRNWIPNIEAILDEPGTNFIAVGAAHLAGPDSVVLMLEEKGYDVERIQ